MSLPVGFYAIHQAADLLQRPTDRVFVRARYVCPIEQVLPGSYPFEHFPRLVLWGGPTTRDMDARYQQIMREHAESLPKQAVTVPKEWNAFGIWFSPPRGFLAVAGPPVSLWPGDWVYGGVRVTPPWPRQAFAWSWALENSAPSGYTLEYDANGQNPRLVPHP